MSHCLYTFRAGQRSQPLSQPVTGAPNAWSALLAMGGRQMRRSQIPMCALARSPTTTVWVAFLNDACLPHMELRKTLAVECTGLGGADLNSPTPWDILVRTGRHHEEVYGPSLARLEFPGAFNQENVMYVGLGLTKARENLLPQRPRKDLERQLAVLKGHP